MKIVEGWIDAATEIDYGNKSMSRQGYKPTHVCLHGTAGGTNAEAIANFFRDTADASAHIIIGTDGEVVQGISMDVAAWANGLIDQPTMPWPPNINPNYYTVSIEHCKASTDNSDQLTDPQKQASFQVIQTICDYYGITKRRGDVQSGIVSHADFDQVNRSRCPGPYPWDELLAYLQTQGGPMIPLGWTDNGATLTAPNKIPVTLGFRDYILNNTWNPADWPLEEAHAQNPLELSNPGIGGGTLQTFRMTVLEWTPTLGVFEAWSGQELLALRAKLAQNTPSTPIVTINTAQAVSTLKTVQVALQTVLHDLEPS
jgi:hypothetical protein